MEYLDESKANDHTLTGLASGVNYFASSTKALTAQTGDWRKKVQWDWLSDPKESTPMKEYIRASSASLRDIQKLTVAQCNVTKELANAAGQQLVLQRETNQLLNQISPVALPDPTPDQSAPLIIVDTQTNQSRSVSPGGYTRDQTMGINATFVPRGWFLQPSKNTHHRRY